LGNNNNGTLGNNNNGTSGNRNRNNNQNLRSQKNESSIFNQPNTSKSFLRTIGNTLGITTPLPNTSSKNFINKINTSIKSECEGEDCDIFTNTQVTQINTNLGNSFKNPQIRFKRARNTLNNLLGKEIVLTKRNKKGNIENLPQTGDIYEYLKT